MLLLVLRYIVYILASLIIIHIEESSYFIGLPVLEPNMDVEIIYRMPEVSRFAASYRLYID